MRAPAVVVLGVGPERSIEMPIVLVPLLQCGSNPVEHRAGSPVQGGVSVARRAPPTLALESALAPGGFPLGLAAALFLRAAHEHTLRRSVVHLAEPDGNERGSALTAKRGLGVVGEE
jgi:hypothetical protein